MLCIWPSSALSPQHCSELAATVWAHASNSLQFGAAAIPRMIDELCDTVGRFNLYDCANGWHSHTDLIRPFLKSGWAVTICLGRAKWAVGLRFPGREGPAYFVT